MGLDLSDHKDPEDAVREYLDGFLKWFGGGGFSRHGWDDFANSWDVCTFHTRRGSHCCRVAVGCACSF